MTSAYIDSGDFEPYEESVPFSTPAASSAELSERSVRYLRVSTRGQMDTDSDVVVDGNSIDSQRQATTAKERALGLTSVP